MAENTSLGVYVTGATTGLGRAVIRQFVARGHRVAGTVESMQDASLIRADGALPVYDDLLRASAIASSLKLAKADVIVNVAPQVINALPIHKPDWDYYERLLAEGAAAVAAAAAQAEAKFIVHTSFAFLYGDTHGEWADESHSITTGDPLFAAAAAGEQAVLGGSVPACVLRAGYLYGAGSQSIHALRHALISRSMMELTDQPASWVHIEDLAHAIVQAVEQQPAGEIFNVADDDPISPAAFVNLFADGLGVAHPGKTNLPASLRQMMTQPAQRALLETSVKARTTKAQETLGWSPQYADKTAGIEQTLLAWRASESV